MYSCPKCSYSLDVSKIDKGNEKTKEMLPLSTSNLKKIKKKSLDIEDYNLDFNIQDLEKNSYYKKLKKEEKITLKNLLSKALNDKLKDSTVEFVCNNCEWNNPITETTLLFKSSMEDETTNYYQHDFALLAKDPTLPRTRDYTCKNLKCITNIPKNKTPKEAVFIRNEGSYSLTYICTVCNFGWTN